jgi:hypothetical protein
MLWGQESHLKLLSKSKNVKLSSVTYRGDQWGYKKSEIPHFLDNRLTEGCEVVSLTRLQRFTPPFLEGSDDLKKCYKHNGDVSRDYSTVHVTTELPANLCVSCFLHGIQQRTEKILQNVRLFGTLANMYGRHDKEMCQILL